MANAPGGGFGRRTGEYVAGRPEYPEELRGSLSVTGNETIIGLGAGTGKFTSVLARMGAEIATVEPDPRMAARIKIG